MFIIRTNQISHKKEEKGKERKNKRTKERERERERETERQRIKNQKTAPKSKTLPCVIPQP